MNTPDTVDTESAQKMYAMINDIRRELKDTAARIKVLATVAKQKESTPASKEDRGETIANLMLTYRHIEDASMRCGKALQAIDGGTSVYDKATTVGA